jgi:hypothetical protein
MRPSTLADQAPALPPPAAPQVLFKDGKLQWERLENLIMLAKEGSSSSSSEGASTSGNGAAASAAASSSGRGGALMGPGAAAARLMGVSGGASSSGRDAALEAAVSAEGLDLTDTVLDGLKVLLMDDRLRTQLIMALTDGNRLHVDEVAQLLRLVGGEVDAPRVVGSVLRDLPSLGRQAMLSWADKVLVS